MSISEYLITKRNCAEKVERLEILQQECKDLKSQCDKLKRCVLDKYYMTPSEVLARKLPYIPQRVVPIRFYEQYADYLITFHPSDNTMMTLLNSLGNGPHRVQDLLSQACFLETRSQKTYLIVNSIIIKIGNITTSRSTWTFCSLREHVRFKVNMRSALKDLKRNRAARTIQRAARRWFEKPYYASGNVGFQARKGYEEVQMTLSFLGAGA